MDIQKYLKEQLDQLSYDAESGIAYGSIRLTARMAGVEDSSIRLALGGAVLNTTKLAEYLAGKGFKGAVLDPVRGLSADVITAICTYYALKAGRYCNATAAEALEMFAQIGLTVAIKQAIGVAVDDRPPAVSPDIAALMQLVTQQSAQISQLLAMQQATAPIVGHEVVKRSGVAAEVQKLRCEAAQIWARDGQRDPNGAKRRMAVLDAEAEALLVNAAVEGGYIHRVKGAARAIGTGTYYKDQEIFRVMPLADEEKVGPFDVVPLSRNRNPRLGMEDRVNIQVAVEKCLDGFNADLLHGGFLYYALFTEAALASFGKQRYKPHLVIGHALAQCGFGRVTQHNKKGGKDCPPDHRTYSVYGRCSVYPEARKQVKRGKRHNGGTTNG